MRAISPLWLPKKRKPLRWNPRCPVHGMAKRCQTQGGKIRVVDGVCVVGEEADCCCTPATPVCGTDWCDTGTQALEILAEVPEMVNNSCSECINFEGTYLLPHDPSFDATSRCLYLLELDASICSATHLTCLLEEFKVDLVFSNGPPVAPFGAAGGIIWPSHILNWAIFTSWGTDCTADISSLPLPFDHQDATQCDISPTPDDAIVTAM